MAASVTGNLAPVVCNLAGNAMQLGGSCFIGLGVLYGVKGISSTMTNTIELLPKYIDKPKTLGSDIEVYTANSSSSIGKIILDTSTKGLLICGTVGAGVLLKKGGIRVAHPQFIKSLESLTMVKPRVAKKVGETVISAKDVSPKP